MSLRTSPSPLLTRDRVIGGCRIDRLIGSGGMGEVYLAHHTALDKPVALKLLPPGDGSAHRIERFLTEARIGSRIEHPNVITMHDAGVEDGLYFIVMQYVDGRNASQLVLDEHRPLEWRSALRIIRHAARGLQAVHTQGILHRDVKPANIMLSRDQRVLLMDFGLVHVLEGSAVARDRSIVGTPAFMSPEQCGGETLDASSDVYSMGCTLYYLLTGKAPYRGSSREIMRQVIGGLESRPPQELNPGVPREVSAFVSRLIVSHNRRTVRTADQLADELGRLAKRPDGVATSFGEAAETSGDVTLPTIEPVYASIELLPDDTAWDRLHHTLRHSTGWVGATAGGAVFLACCALAAWILLR